MSHYKCEQIFADSQYLALLMAEQDIVKSAYAILNLTLFNNPKLYKCGSDLLHVLPLNNVMLNSRSLCA